MEFTVFSSLSVSAVSGKFQTRGFLLLNIQLYNSYLKTNLSIQNIYNDAILSPICFSGRLPSSGSHTNITTWYNMIPFGDRIHYIIVILQPC